MRLLTTLCFLTLFSLTLKAQTTMCFKENHKSMSTIEDTKLEGGLCEGKKSSKEMQKDGWTTADIKIDGTNYIYIFKKETAITEVNMEALEQKVLKRLETKKEKEKLEAKIEFQKSRIKNGKTFYVNKCQNCHGIKGELRPSNTSRAINKLTLKEFTTTIRDYKLNDYDRGRAILMKPYAFTLNTKDIKNIYVYLQNLNGKLKEIKEDKK